MGLKYTGHPFVDVGVATIVSWAGVVSPDELTESHLTEFVERILEIYMTPAMSGYLSYVVFANARFANPAQIRDSKYDDARQKSLSSVLNLWRNEAVIPDKEEPADEDEKCVFCGQDAIIRASRILIPMTTDETNINFVPEGRPKLPICGWCLLAILSMPLGALNSNGKMWIVHSTDPNTLEYFAGANLRRNLEMFSLQSVEKLPNYKFAKTFLMNDLIDAQGFRSNNMPLTGYLFTSSSQKSEIDIFHLPSNVVSFITSANRRYPNAWRETIQRAWALQADQAEESEPGKIVYQDRNYFYEDLFDLPRNARGFLRRYFLRRPIFGKPTGKQKLDPRFNYSLVKEQEMISWELTGLFLEKVMKMDKERIVDIRNLADRLATYIQEQDERLFKKLFLAKNDYQLRLELLRAANAANGKLLPYNEFINVFFIDEGDTAKPDWYLARDLLMVRIIEQLRGEWAESHKDLLAEVDQATEENQD